VSEPGVARASGRRLLPRGCLGFALGVWLLAALASLVWRNVTPTPEAPLPDGMHAVRIPEHRAGVPTGRTLRLAYFEAGVADGRPTLLLVHGSPGGGDNFAKLLGPLGDDFHVIAPDLPGFGASARQPADLSLAAHGHDLLELLDALHVERAHVLGFSMGGGPALELYDEAPERVASLTLLASLGVQELEWLGDYRLNHALHGAVLLLARAADLVVPHFGATDAFDTTIAFARNFYESDQRPLRALLERFEPPMLIVHGADDPLVPLAAALEHQRIVPQSRLVQPLARDDHFFVFFSDAAAEVAALVRDFVLDVEAGRAPRRANADPARVAAAARAFDPADAPPASGGFLTALVLILAFSTLVSEDLTCIAAGLMVASGKIDYLPAAAACFAGIFVGDMLLFLAGRLLGRTAVRRAPLRWLITPAALERSSRWFARRGPQVILLSRFLPGMRLPTYLAAGVIGTSALWFAAWFALAGLLWTPTLVALSSVAGARMLATFGWIESHPWLGFFAVLGGLLLVLRVFVPLLTHRGRRLLLGSWKRWTRWEFWPPWLFYPPVLAWVAWLALRHRGLRLVTAVNPAIPTGGFLGESKGDILDMLRAAGAPLPADLRLSAELDLDARRAAVAAFREAHALGLPLVVKPDAGQRGLGVTIARDEATLDEALRAPVELIVQEFVGGPEFGVFWLHRPGAPHGEVFSITEKLLPTVTGDGVRTLERLILDDPRAVALARTYLAPFGARLDDVPAAGETIPLAELGTHCLGAIFLDGSRLHTPELEAAVDAMALPLDGFHFGRFDLRAPSPEHLSRGEGLRVMELNGLTSEATSIYDARHGVLHAYRVLFQQWSLAFEIAAAQRANGVRPTSWGELFATAFGFLRGRRRAAREDVEVG